MSLSGKFCSSTDEEQFHGAFDTREEAIADLPDGEGWTGQCVEPDIDSLAKHAAEVAADQIELDLSEECGEASELFSVTGSEQDELACLIAVWLKKVGLGCYKVIDVQRHDEETSHAPDPPAQQ